MLRIAINTLGCKTNQAESAAIISQFDPSEIALVDFDSEADIYIINTCTVTNRTDFKSRNLIRKALSRKGQKPDTKVIVTGCYAQRSKDEVYSLGDVDLVIDNQHKLDLKELLENPSYEFEDIMEAQGFHFRLQEGALEHSRAFQKIQDGCDYYCTYCAVPYARGHNRSASLEEVLSQAEKFVENGYNEIVLGGVNLGLWRDSALGLKELLVDLSKIKHLEIIRLSSLEPQLFSDDLLETIAELPKIAPHFHIALQSGSNSVLKRMGRVYDTQLVSSLLSKIRSKLPHAAIGADLICGFPGETDEEFQESMSFVEASPLTYLHVFAYSKRKGTPAATMPQQIHGDLKKARSRQMIDLSERKKALFSKQLVDSQVVIRGIVEKTESGVATFLSDHFIRAYTRQSCRERDLISIVPTGHYLDGLSDF